MMDSPNLKVGEDPSTFFVNHDLPPPEGAAPNHKGPTEERLIYINAHSQNIQFNYPNNIICTSRYNMLTFLPINLFQQFRRVANAYFLFLLILQLIPVISALSPVATAAPLVFVLFLTGVKDGYEDYQRHQSDHLLNTR
eukprot:Sdes_comp23383_c0_seq1m21645